MSKLPQATPAELGLDERQFAAALAQLKTWCDNKIIPSAGLVFGRRGKISGPHVFGNLTLGAQLPPVAPDSIFLIASITKPIVAMAVVKLVERGLLALDERVEDYIPGFGKQGKHAITLRHLLTHTSGLPDMLPDNRELRVGNAPLSAFVQGTCAVAPDFAAGRSVQYQSTGFAMLGEIVHQVSGQTCAQFLHDEFFEPMGMDDTALGAPNGWFDGATPRVARIAEVRVPDDHQEGVNWNWNSRYWRQLGVPWGGLLTTCDDLATYAQMMLGQGRLNNQRLLGTASVRAATRNQLEGLRDLNDTDRRTRPWGLGWRLHWPAHSANFGEFLGPNAYGHWGATGTLLWIDPDLDAFLILLTTQPQEPSGNHLCRISNMVAAAL